MTLAGLLLCFTLAPATPATATICASTASSEACGAVSTPPASACPAAAATSLFLPLSILEQRELLADEVLELDYWTVSPPPLANVKTARMLGIANAPSLLRITIERRGP